MRTIVINSPGPQGATGPQGPQGPSGSVDTSFLATTGSNAFVGNQTINGNVTVSGTASINTLVVNQTVLSTGSNTLGDAANDTQTLYGSVIMPTGSLAVSGSTLIATAMTDANNAPLVVQNLTAYSNPFTQYIQIWKNSAGTILSSLRADGFFDIPVGGLAAPSVSARANGSATAPVFTRSNNATTGIFFPTTNNIAISTNGVEALRVSPSSSILIGTTTDSGYKLDVNGTARIGDSTNGWQFSTNNITIVSNGFLGVDVAGNRHFSITDKFGFSTYYFRVAPTTGNILIGTTTDPGAKLYISGSSGSALLRVDSPASSSILYVSGSGNVGINTTGSSAYTLDVNGTARISSTIQANGFYTNAANGIGFFSPATAIRFSTNDNGANIIANNTPFFSFANNSTAITRTSGTGKWFELASFVSFAPTSGTTTMDWLSIAPTINQTGGANGITRGIYINPTLTAAADWRAIETTSGSVIFNHGATPLMFISSSGNVGIRTSNPTTALHVSGGLLLTGSALNAPLILSDSNYIYGGGTATSANAIFGANASQTELYARNNRIGIWASGGSGNYLYSVNGDFGVGIGANTPSARLQIRGSGATSATTTFQLQNSTPTNLLTVLDNGQVSFTSPTMSLAVSQSAFSISPIISASNVVGGQYYGVNITPTFFQTTGSQTETAFRVAATFTSSNATATSGSNIIADFGSTSAGSQLTVTDVTSGSIYMVNDVSGIPIIEATSNWDVNIYDFPNKVFEKTGSQVNIYGTMRVSGSFILPLSQSVAPQTGSAYWSGSLLFIYDGTRYRSASFA